MSKRNRNPHLDLGALEADGLVGVYSVPNQEVLVMTNKIIRVISRASNGALRTREYENFDEISELHDQIGIDDCSTDLTLRGMPLFRGLVGPMPESKTTVRYESPDVFEFLTKEWAQAKSKRRRRTKSETTADAAKEKAPIEKLSKPNFVPIPKMNVGTTISSPFANY